MKVTIESDDVKCTVEMARDPEYDTDTGVFCASALRLAMLGVGFGPATVKENLGES